MRFEIVGKNIKVTEGMKTKIENKLTFLDKYLLIDENTIARVVVRVYPTTQKIEVTIPTKVGTLRTEVMHQDLYAAIDLAIDKLEDQIRRQKTRLSRKHRGALAEAFIEKDEDLLSKGDVPVKTKTISIQGMDLEEAITRMEMLDHDFFIYNDSEDDTVAVVYRRKEGGYGLIEVDKTM